MPISTAFLAVFISTLSPFLKAPTMTCILKVDAKEGAKISEVKATLILINNTTKAIEIPWNLDPLQYLDLKITGPDGKQLATEPYSMRFSPFSNKPIILMIKPGESYRSAVGLFGAIEPADQKPGVYKFRAVYDYQGQKFEAPEVSISVTLK